MLASIQWLRALCSFEEDAEQVANALTARGLTVDAVIPSAGDTALELDIPANRPDCLGHRGVARELAAAFGRPLLPPAPAPAPGGDSIEGRVRVEIEDPVLCPRYSARVVRGVRVGPSPDWVVRRLEACGLRSVSNVVDASNLVMLELANPIHFFDLARVPGPAIVVRRARDGERLRMLDGVERKLEPEMLVIADRERAIALAGVIGGAETEIGGETRDVLIEAAYFEPSSIRRTARRLGVATDASHRFERGVDPEGVPLAQELAVKLLAELAGGTPAPGIVDVYPEPVVRPALTLRPGRIAALLGYAPAAGEIGPALEALGLQVAPASDGTLRVGIPSWRVDLTREADLVEEVARHLGYERIPSTVGASAVPLQDQPARESLSVEERARDVLAHQGFLEAFNYAMIGADEDVGFVAESARPALPLENPIAEPLSHLRRSLLPGLVRSADYNLRRGAGDVRLYEVGRVFLPRGEGEFPDERLRAGVVWSGTAAPPHWGAPSREAGLHDVAGVVELLIETLRPGLETERRAEGPSALHPGRAASWRLPSGEELAWGGALHPELRAKHDLDRDLLMAEIDLERLVAQRARPAMYRPLPRVPAVTRDLSLILGRERTFAEVRDVIRAVPCPAPVEVEVIDRYEGQPLGADRVSLTVRLTLSPQERTLRDEETEGYRTAVIEALRRDLHVGLRG